MLGVLGRGGDAAMLGLHQTLRSRMLRFCSTNEPGLKP